MDVEAIQGYLCHGDPSSQTRALQYFEQLKTSEDGWHICTSNLKSGHYQESHVKFFCLQVIEHFVKTRYEQADIAQQQEIKDLIFHLIHVQQNSEGEEQLFIRNKIAQLVSLVFLVDYPHRWPSFFTDLLQIILFGPKSVDYYLRILLAINSDVADRVVMRTQKELERNSLIKDSIREHSIRDLVHSWYHIVTSYQNSKPELSELCLKVIGEYIAWINIGLIANDRFVGILVEFLSHPEPRLREASLDCIHEIINKGMEPNAKIKLVDSFLTVLEQAGVLNNTDENDTDFSVKLAKLVNIMGTSVILACKRLINSRDVQVLELTKREIENKVPLMLKFLNHEDEIVSEEVCEFAREYVLFLKHELKDTVYDNMEKSNIEALLYIIINRYKYDDCYNFAHQGEDEAMFDEYRKSLKVLFDNIAELDKALVLSRVQEMAAKTLPQWQSVPFQDIEVAITFIYLLEEAIPANQTGQFESNRQAVIAKLLQLLVTSGVNRHGHIAVNLQFFEVIVRYNKFFTQEPQHIPEMLIAFVDERGLRHSSPKVRSRTSYLFSRYIKSLKSHIQSYTEEILKQLQELLVLASPENGLSVALLSPDDQLYLYEAAATLIVSSQFDYQKKQLLLKNILSPVIEKFEMLLQRLSLEQDKEMQHAIAECMSHAIAVTSRTSKAFSSQQTMKSCGCVQVYLDSLEVFLRSFELPYEQSALQSAVRQYLHRMVVCLEEEILPFIPGAAEKLLKSTDIRSIQEFIPLINQIISKFKLSWIFQKEIVPYLLQIFMPLVSTIFSALTVPIDENDQQAQRERQLLRRSYFFFIAAVVTNNVTEVISSQDMQSLEQVLVTIIHGAVDFPDPVAQRTCFSVLRKMVELWGGPDGAPGFLEFMYKSIVPACFIAPLKDTFDLTDAQTILALSESALCLKTVLDKRGEEFVNFLQSQYLPTLHISASVIQEYCQALKSDTKVFKNYLKLFFQQAKS